VLVEQAVNSRKVRLGEKRASYPAGHSAGKFRNAWYWKELGNCPPTEKGPSLGRSNKKSSDLDFGSFQLWKVGKHE